MNRERKMEEWNADGVREEGGDIGRWELEADFLCKEKREKTVQIKYGREEVFYSWE